MDCKEMVALISQYKYESCGNPVIFYSQIHCFCAELSLLLLMMLMVDKQ